MNKFNINQINFDNFKRARARYKHLNFVEYNWSTICKDSFLIGKHTLEISDKIDQAIYNFKQGKSTFLCVLVCFRHGKSQLTSRTLVPHFIGEFPDHEILVTSHNNDIIRDFSFNAKKIIQSNKYQSLYPNIKLSNKINTIDEWRIKNYNGIVRYISLHSGTAGVGSHLCIVDDYFGSPADARSEKIRDTVWYNFTEGVYSRLMHPCICVVCVTPWHVDDLIGRIRKHMLEDKNFPPFEFISYPAFSSSYEQGVLFPEKYPMSWYEQHKAVLIAQRGVAAYESLMQCSPQIIGGNLFKIENIQYYHDISQFIMEQ